MTVSKPELPDARECAIMLLMLLETRNGTTRARLSEMTLKRIWKRQRLKEDFVSDIAEWLYRAGWALFYANSTFAIVKISVVMDWPRLSSKRMLDILSKVEAGDFDFEKHASLITKVSDADTDE